MTYTATTPADIEQKNSEIYSIPSLSHLDQRIYDQADTKHVLRKLVSAKSALSLLKGSAKTIPNQDILINTLFLQEAKASSAVENIFTTQDALFRGDLGYEGRNAPEAKEVRRYNAALHQGFNLMLKKGALLTNNVLISIFQTLENRKEGFRIHPVVLRNDRTGENVHVPPADPSDVLRYMADLENFINNDDLCDLDPLIKMAIIHHQFESIHPFADGSGRTGRILNVLYLTKTGLLDIPILYLSRAINRNKDIYYKKLQNIRDSGAWEEWIIFILEAVEETAGITLDLIKGLGMQMREMKEGLRKELPSLYSQDLLNILFRYPYTKSKYLEKHLRISRQTATKRLNALTEKGFLEKMPSGRENYFINYKLIQLFLSVSGGD